MQLFYTSLDTPINKLLLLSDGLNLCGCYFANQESEALKKADIENDNLDIFAQAKQQLQNYFKGQQKSFNLPLKFVNGTPFQQRVWNALKSIPYGKTLTYSEIAAQLDAPKSARPIGAAIGKNPIAIIIPCHRVIGKNGELTGFAGGLPRKKTLLDLEI